MMKNIVKAFLLLFLLSCKNYHNDFIHWADSIKEGTPIEEVRQSQPEYISIDWNKPEVSDSTMAFYVTDIEGDNDILKMSHSLIFSNDRFIMRESRK